MSDEPMDLDGDSAGLVEHMETESDNPSAGFQNAATGGNSVAESVVSTQPQPAGSAVSYGWTDHQTPFHPGGSHQGFPAGSSDLPVSQQNDSKPPDYGTAQSASLHIAQAQQKSANDSKPPDYGTAQSASSHVEQGEAQLQHFENEEEMKKNLHGVTTQNVTGAAKTNGTQPSAPPDTAKFNIRVEWTEEFPERWKAFLQKALQKWFNSELSEDVKENFGIAELQLMSEKNQAEVKIAPSRALDIVKKTKTATLMFKELNKSAKVHFQLDIKKPEQLNQEVSVDEDKAPMPQTSKDTFYKDDVSRPLDAGMDAGAVKNDPGASGAPPPLSAPLHQYWYFSHIYKKEIGQIQERFGVQINTEVSVSFTAKDQTRLDSIRKASDELTDLFQTSTTSLQSLPIPQMQLDSDIVKDVVRNIQSDQTRMALMMSADGCILSGPKNTISGVQSRLSSEFGQKYERSFGSNVAGKMEIDKSYTSRSSTMEMAIKDTQDSIVMSNELWNLMNKTSHKKLAEIENKYGVQISVHPAQDSTIKVTINSKDDQLVNLESHAYRAFTHLYQKISMSAITCQLTSPLDEKNVKNELDAHRLVGVNGTFKIRKLIGLQRNLAPAIADIEKRVGKPVFDDKTKELIDYSKNSHKFSNQSWWRKEGGSSSSSGPGSSVDPESSAKKESASNDDNCPICMDTFTDEKKLKCGHGFCRDCLKQAEKSMGEICPVCKKVYGKVKGIQPKGKMTHRTTRTDLPGYTRCGTIEITYDIPSGVQTEEHPNPGKPYYGAQRHAYLPNNAEGNHVLQLLRRAFDQRLIFTVGTSTTTGAQNMVTWNDIHHKTNMYGGPESYGYPDPDYLKRVKDELKAKGIE